MSETQQKKLRSLRDKARRKGLKLLAIGERVRVRMLDRFGKAFEVTGKVRRTVARHPVSPLLYAVVLALAIGAVTFNGMYTRAYVLSVDGVEIGMVADESDVEAIVAHVETRAASILGEDYAYDGELTVTPALAAADDMSDLSEVENVVFASVGALVEAYAISVDGVELGYAPTLEAMQELLDRVAEPYLNEKTTGYDFVENVEIFPVELPANTEYQLEDLFAVLTAFEVEEGRYVVKKDRKSVV